MALPHMRRESWDKPITLREKLRYWRVRRKWVTGRVDWMSRYAHDSDWPVVGNRCRPHPRSRRE
jgi:hypothetical protein